MSKYEHPLTVFSEKKNSPINLLCIKPAHMFTLGLPVSNSYVTWILTAPNPSVVSVYNSIDMECRLAREAHLLEGLGDASVLSSMSTAKFVCATSSLGCSAWIVWILYATLLVGAFCVAHHALLNMEFVTAT
jgi:hypothetical protein